MVTAPEASVTRIVTPDRPGSSPSRTPFPLTSLNFTPLIVPPTGRFPNRMTETDRCAKLITAWLVPGTGGAVCVNPAGTVSLNVKVPKGTFANVKLPWASVTTDSWEAAVSLIEDVRVIVTPASPVSPASRTPLPFASRNFVR